MKNIGKLQNRVSLLLSNISFNVADSINSKQNKIKVSTNIISCHPKNNCINIYFGDSIICKLTFKNENMKDSELIRLITCAIKEYLQLIRKEF